MSMDKQDNCIFCAIAVGEAPSHKLWENDTHMAFLSIFPNTEGFSVVIPKKHYPSYVFDVPEETMLDLVKAAKTVAQKIDAHFDDVGRTGLMFEGFGVDHLHAKLFPMHGTNNDQWKEHKATIDTYFDNYPGYMSSHDSDRGDDEKLAKLAKSIRDNI